MDARKTAHSKEAAENQIRISRSEDDLSIDESLSAV